MKTAEAQLTQWAAGTITYDYGDDPGVMRIYTQEAWTQYCTHLLVISGCYSSKPEEAESKEPSPDRTNELERTLASLRRLIFEIATRPDETRSQDENPKGTRFLPYNSASGGAPDEKLCMSWIGFMQNFLDPKRMLRYDGSREVLTELRSLLTEGLYSAIRP